MEKSTKVTKSATKQTANTTTTSIAMSFGQNDNIVHLGFTLNVKKGEDKLRSAVNGAINKIFVLLNADRMLKGGANKFDYRQPFTFHVKAKGITFDSSDPKLVDIMGADWVQRLKYQHTSQGRNRFRHNASLILATMVSLSLVEDGQMVIEEVTPIAKKLK